MNLGRNKHKDSIFSMEMAHVGVEVRQEGNVYAGNGQN